MAKAQIKKQKKQCVSKSTALGIVRRYFPNVKKVIDADEDIEVRVTKKDCDTASSKIPEECAMAKAVKRHHSGAIISNATSYVIDGDVATRFKTPMSVTKEIVSFDRNHTFEPGEYSLRAPAATERLGPRTRPQHTKNRNNKRRRVYHMTEGIRTIGRGGKK